LWLARTSTAMLLGSLQIQFGPLPGPAIFHFYYEISCRSESSNISLVSYSEFQVPVANINLTG
jgi:hypothetical protein